MLHSTSADVQHGTCCMYRTGTRQIASSSGCLQVTYHELQGFLFTIVSAPELIPASEWLPIIFAGEDIDYASVEQAEAVIGQIMCDSRSVVSL